MAALRLHRSPHLVVLSGVVLLLSGGLAGCANGHNLVTGRITPEHFDFRPVVKKSGPRTDPSGWWAVCIHASITQGDSGARSICKFEVGLPQRNEDQGDISLKDAQEAAAEMANRAIYKVLSEAHPGTMHAIHCINFKKIYRLMLREKIYGSEVGACETKGVKIIHFELPCDCER